MQETTPANINLSQLDIFSLIEPYYLERYQRINDCDKPKNYYEIWANQEYIPLNIEQIEDICKYNIDNIESQHKVLQNIKEPLLLDNLLSFPIFNISDLLKISVDTKNFYKSSEFSSAIFQEDYLTPILLSKFLSEYIEKNEDEENLDKYCAFITSNDYGIMLIYNYILYKIGDIIIYNENELKHKKSLKLINSLLKIVEQNKRQIFNYILTKKINYEYKADRLLEIKEIMLLCLISENALNDKAILNVIIDKIEYVIQYAEELPQTTILAKLNFNKAHSILAHPYFIVDSPWDRWFQTFCLLSKKIQKSRFFTDEIKAYYAIDFVLGIGMKIIDCYIKEKPQDSYNFLYKYINLINALISFNEKSLNIDTLIMLATRVLARLIILSKHFNNKNQENTFLEILRQANSEIVAETIQILDWNNIKITDMDISQDDRNEIKSKLMQHIYNLNSKTLSYKNKVEFFTRIINDI